MPLYTRARGRGGLVMLAVVAPLLGLTLVSILYLLVRRWLCARTAARVGAGSCTLVGSDGTLAQQVGVRAPRRGGLPALAPPQPPEWRPDERPGARPRSPLAPRARRRGRGGDCRAGRPRTPPATRPFRRRRSTLSGCSHDRAFTNQQPRHQRPRALLKVTELLRRRGVLGSSLGGNARRGA